MQPTAISRQDTPLSARHFWVLALALSLVVVILVGVAWSPLAEEYLLTVKAPPLEREFGFRAAYVSVQPPRGAPERVWRVFALTAVTPGGAFESAGFRVGDRLCVGLCRFYGDYVAPEAFLQDVERAKAGDTVEFAVARGDPADIHRIYLSNASHNKQQGFRSRPRVK
jgi:hypothetical protein